MSRIALPPSKFVRRVGSDQAGEVFVPRIALPDGSRVFLRHKQDDQPQRVALPRRKGVQ